MIRSHSEFFKQQERRIYIISTVFWIFFAIVAAIVISIFVLQGYLAYQVLTNPNSVGSYVGEIVNGINQTIK